MERTNNLVRGDKLLTVYNQVIIFLEYYNEERP